MNQESEDELLRRAIAMSLECTDQAEEVIDPNQMTDHTSSQRPGLVDQESEDELLRRAIAMSLEDTDQGGETFQPDQMNEEELI